jgi:hypothetical protein
VQGTALAGELHTAKTGELGGTFATKYGMTVEEETDGNEVE